MLNPITQNEGQWDQFVRQHGGGFLQSWDWARFQEALGRRVYRFRMDAARAPGEDEMPGQARTVAQFVMVDLPLPMGQRYLYVPRGPIVAVDDAATVQANLASSVEALREHMRAAGATFARVEWPWPVTGPMNLPVVTAEQAHAWGFSEAGHVQPQHTVINDLRRSDEEQLAAMHQKTRYNIKVAQKHGVTVREALGRGNAMTPTSPEARQRDIDAFWQMLDVTAKRDKFSTHERDYYAKMIETLAIPHAADDALRVRLWLAEYQGRPVAGALTAEFGDTVTYLHGASLDSDRNVMAPFVLHWEIMRAAKTAGHAFYDFWGVAPEGADNHSWAGITRFKVGFGGQRVSYLGAWELPGNAFWYRVYRLAKRLHP